MSNSLRQSGKEVREGSEKLTEPTSVGRKRYLYCSPSDTESSGFLRLILATKGR